VEAAEITTFYRSEKMQFDALVKKGHLPLTCQIMDWSEFTAGRVITLSVLWVARPGRFMVWLTYLSARLGFVCLLKMMTWSGFL
jgi:hypothetical protein